MPNEFDDISQEGVKLDDKTDEQLDNLKNEEEEETSTDSSTETKPKEAVPADETAENIPFHKHPRFQEVIAQKNELFEKNKLLEERLTKLETSKENEQVPARPAWFTKLYGEDDEAWKLYWENETQLEEQREERVRNRILREQQETDQKLTQAEQDAKSYIENSIQTLKDEGHQFDRKELEAVMKKYTPTDDDNNLDFRKGLGILMDIKKAGGSTIKDTARKEVASSTVAPSKPTGKEKPFGTTVNLRNKSFNSLASED